MFHGYDFAIDARWIGNLNSALVAALLNQGGSESMVFLMAGNDRRAACAFSE